MDINTRFQYRFNIQGLSIIKGRKWKIYICLGDISIDGKKSVNYAYNAVILYFILLWKSTMYNHPQRIAVSEYFTGKITANYHFILFQHTNITTHTSLQNQ